MHRSRDRRRNAAAEAGFTLMETMIACFLVVIGLVATSRGLTVGLQGVEGGRQQSVAVFLAEQRLEQVRAAARATPKLASVTTANFPSEGYGAMAGAPKYRRTVTITPFVGPAGGLPAGTQGARVDVNVFYRPVTALGVSTTERQVQLSLFLGSR
jgi:type II secretory pathway pseudopilin PulG